MKKALAITLTALLSVSCIGMANASDPEAAARQAEIDRDLAQSKIRQLEDDSIAGGVVQDEATVEINARNRQIADLEEESEAAERREEIAESRERVAGGQ
jgi:hypothetical protein